VRAECPDLHIVRSIRQPGDFHSVFYGFVGVLPVKIRSHFGLKPDRAVQLA